MTGPDPVIQAALDALRAFAGHHLNRHAAQLVLPWWRHYPSLTDTEREQVLAAFPIGRCPAAHPEDLRACDGPRAVWIIDAAGTATEACVRHGTTLYASLDGARVYPLPGHDAAAIQVYDQARQASPR